MSIKMITLIIVALLAAIATTAMCCVAAATLDEYEIDKAKAAAGDAIHKDGI